jgi:hypothetical protein
MVRIATVFDERDGVKLIRTEALYAAGTREYFNNNAE